ncbi:hypothetical protein [Flavobacterium faecale]|uniref:hypothetical protein n=1 Tax=Flavobacterium faecale TaxID=1355330 RepID=UPI003AAD35E9
MITQIRNSSLITMLWGLMGVLLLNLSVDSADPYPPNIPENLAFNDQESIIEIVVEKLLGYENAIEEHDDNDTENHTKKSNHTIDLALYPFLDSAWCQQLYEIKRKINLHFKSNITNGFRQLDTPPPN